MANEGKDAHHEDVFDSLQGASSLTLLKKISLAAVAIALVAFFLFWSRSPSEDEKTTSQDTSGPFLRDRIVSLEEEVSRIKEELRKIAPLQYEGSAQDALKQSTLASNEGITPSQPESINLKSLFDEELRSSSSGKESVPDEQDNANVKEPATKTPVVNKAATKPQVKQDKVVGKSTSYVVKKGDTLSKIAQKFYGSPLKWKRIVEANKAILGHNNMLKVGMKLAIPQEE